MASRTIIINGDKTWPFAELLWAHGLDLYAPSFGVSFVSVFTPEDTAPGNPDYNLILGNFPESFGKDSESLVNEIADEVSALEEETIDQLAVLAIVSSADFEALARAQGHEGSAQDDKFDGLSEGGRAIVLALQAAMDRIGDFSGDQGRVSRVAPRLWLSLVVRERGFDIEHKTAAARICAYLKGRNTGLRSVFFLSNGRGMDTGPNHPHLHFKKVRLLVDVLEQATEAGFERDLQGSQGEGAAVWLQLTESSTAYLESSSILLQHLLQAYERVHSGSGNAAGLATSDEVFAKQSEDLLNDIGSAFDLEEARAVLLNRLTAASRTSDIEAFEGENSPHPAPLNPETIALRYTSSRPGSFFRNNGLKRRIENDAIEFDRELGRISSMIDKVVNDALAFERLEKKNTRKRILNSLDNLQLPSRTKSVGEFREQVQEKLSALNVALANGKQRAEIATADMIENGGTAHREDLKERLLAAENDLLGRGSLLKVSLVFSALVLLPFLFVILARAMMGQMPDLSGQTIHDAVFPVPYIIIVVLVTVFFVGVLRAWLVARNRDKAHIAFGKALMADYTNCIEKGVGRYMRGVNRARLAVANLIDSRIDVVSPEAIRKATEAFISTLTQTHQNLAVRDSSSSESNQSFVQPALEGFSSGIQMQEKINGFMKGIIAPQKGELQIELPGGAGRETKVETHASKTPPKLVVAVPGHD